MSHGTFLSGVRTPPRGYRPAVILSWLGASFVTGLAGAPHCLGMCGALACAAGGSVRDQVPYHVGRIGTYAVLGAICGAFGQLVPGPTWLASAVAAVLLVVFALSLSGLVPAFKPRMPWLARLGADLGQRRGVASRLAFGVVNGLLPCGLLYAALAIPVASADAAVGALCMAVFGVATVPALGVATFGFRSLLTQSLVARRVLALVVLLTGLGTIAWREGWLDPWLASL